ncbi:MAG: fimbrillin family protein [Bacteroidaceae bacterium]|nr:fimbrillin family protein [Bacteroidaceae bacterium]
MKSRCLLMAAFALMLVSCAKDAESIDSTPIEKGNTNVVAQQPVSFGAYVNRATTRAGAAGELTNDGANGKVSLQDEGFGVFAYFTDDKPYTPDYNPNFMYNTQVTYDASANAWTYSPMRYWPNENSANDASEGIDRLSFFAYAPHVNVSPLTGMVDANDSPDSGIVYMSRNGAEGDPFVNYIVNFDPAKQVDFCWGTPQVDMTKPEVSDPVEFEFNHTLAALNVQIDALLDKVDPNTKIFVRSVSFEGFADRGSFNLNTPADKLIWYDVTGRDYIEGGKVTVYDGRTNGHEGSSEAVNELPNGLNPLIVQSAKYGETGLPDGVTSNVVNLFGSASNDAPILVIPTGQPLKVTIVYDVETLVPTLPGYLSDGVTHGTSVENNISKSITLNTGENIKMEAGKKYTLNLHLGLTSMNFDATVSDWAVGASGDAELPVNTDASVAVSGISLNMSSMKLASNGEANIVATVEPNNVTNQSVNWTSDNPNIASVVNGKVTAVAVGSTTIYATTVDGNISESCTVEVVPATLAALKSVAADLSDAEMALYKAMDVDSDGNINISDPQNEILGKQYDATKKIGFIAYISPDSDVDTGVSGSRILVMASNNVSSNKLLWSSNSSSNNHPVSVYNSLLDGYYATMAMSGGTFEAKDALETWAADVTKPDGSSGWFMPSIGQWYVISQWIGTTQIEFIQGETLRDQAFLSSSESIDDSPYTIWVCDFSAQTGYFNDTPYKEEPYYYTRAIFAY